MKQGYDGAARTPLPDAELEQLERVLDALEAGRPGDPVVDAFVRRLTPAIHARVVRALLASAAPGSWSAAVVADRVYDTWATLWKDRARLLRAWNPQRGVTLEQWVGRCAALGVRDWLERSRANPSPKP